MASAKRYSWSLSNGRTREAYRARWVDAAGAAREKKGFDRHADALAYAQDREAEARHGITLEGERMSGRTTVKAWSVTWLSGLDVSPGTQDAYAYALKRILPAFGGRTLASLRPSEIKAWRRALTRRDGEPLAPTTANATAAVLAMMLRAAVQDGLLDRSPFPSQRGAASELEGRVVDPDELLTLDQVRAWGSALPAHAQEMPIVAATLGLRQGELLGLRLSNVDFLRRQVRVVEQLQTPPGPGAPTWRKPKTAAGVRTLPLPTPAAEALARHLERQPPVDGEPIFRGARGQRWRRGSFHTAWAGARTAADLPAWAHWHALRDVYASSLIRAGVDVRTVMTLLGHTSAEETLRTYARLWPDAQDVARQAVENLWAPDDGHGVGTGGAASP